MGPCKDPSTPAEKQATTEDRWPKRRARRPRSRLCLLKDCGRSFRPQHPLRRYCSPECREQARQWRQWKARRRYRQTKGCKEKRQAQSCRYRTRLTGPQDPKNSRRKTARGSSLQIFFVDAVTAPDATRISRAAGARRCSGSVRLPVAGRWNGCWSEKDVGEPARVRRQGVERCERQPGTESLPLSS